MKLAEVQKMLDENAAVPVWPEAGKALGLTRGAAYQAAQSGDLPTIRFGRLLRVPSAALRAMLKLETSAA
jgi:excisionase family DNA binding protein